MVQFFCYYLLFFLFFSSLPFFRLLVLSRSRDGTEKKIREGGKGKRPASNNIKKEEEAASLNTRMQHLPTLDSNLSVSADEVRRFFFFLGTPFFCLSGRWGDGGWKKRKKAAIFQQTTS
eukprot:TRINITY_DN4891_c2_g1_i1.p1 TRINITY_DN4891_c2_g1~~TRINITY_DN4891_c2_g1_i1.p1  ORF type:complete len:119 (-),score=5.37 TRINITY_DN4891_c2_g1_i1:625-981(-)